MMTGYDIQESIDAAVDEGAIYVVYKPFEPQQIVQVLRSAHQPCPEKLPANICAVAGKIQQNIDGAIEGSPITRVAVRVPDCEMRALRLLAASGPAAEYTQTLGSSAGLGGIAFYNNELKVINDYVSHPLSSESDVGLGVKSAMAVPISTDTDRVLGSIAVGSYEAEYFKPDVVKRFSGLAREAGNLMEAASPAEAELLHGLSHAGIPDAQSLAQINR